ncbi:hypothetical protein DNTS_001783 [Danionella cerebrum]|uniref:PX domain-containing protein n=1 Tax=Danionella cerebrum TaxID=2873325 RepID=A0A553MNR8_9TELE|nr:hypothetical protein DNTS_001783 [Danionella translucida]
MGSVPSYYRDVHQAISSRSDERVPVSVFQRLLGRTSLSSIIQNQIIEQVNGSDGLLSKLSLYKGLALIALAQQGKPPSPKLLETCIQELPKPQLGELKDLQSLKHQLVQENPLILTLNLDELLKKDTIKVELTPEKKGLFLKHVEYQVTSQVLLQRYAYRAVPSLPPKRVLKGVLTSMSEREFIEGRRRALARFLNLVARHPVFSEDELVKTFFTFSGSDFLPADSQSQFLSCRQLIRNIHCSFQKLRDRAERMVERSKENATDLLMFGKELSSLGSDECPVPDLGSCTRPWAALRHSVRGLSPEFSLLSEKAVQQARREEDDVVEKLDLFLDLLQSYRELCERHEKGLLHEQQRALQKYGLMKRQTSVPAQPKEQLSVEQLESRIIQQESAIHAMELRSSFSLFCLHQETQLLFTHLPLTSHILASFVNSQVQGHQEMGEVWQDLHSKLQGLFGGDRNGHCPPLSPK